MYCPKCGHPQHCPCDSCKSRLPKGTKPWVWIDECLIKCGNCDLTQHCDWWLDVAWEVYRSEREKEDGNILRNRSSCRT